MNETWTAVSRVPSLPPAEVHVWRIDVPVLTHRSAALRAVLDDAERARGDALHQEADRRRYAVARGVLRILVGRYVDVAPDGVRFVAGPFGKPHYVGTEGARIAFNVSHSGDVVLIALAREGDVGVDVERWSERLGEAERTRIADSVFSSVERAAIGSLRSTAERERAFYTLWSRKEAYLKGTGAGISGGLSHVDLSVDGRARLVEDRRDALAAERWALRDLDVGSGYSAALAFSPMRQDVSFLLPSPHLFGS